MANRVVTKICGEEFTFLAEDPAEYVQKVSAYVHEQMTGVLNSAKVGRTQGAILTAVNIADELFKTREADEQLRSQIKGYLEESSRNKAEISDLKREVLRLQKAQKKLEKQEGEKEKPARTTKSRTSRAKTVLAPAPVETAEPVEEPAESPEVEAEAAVLPEDGAEA